MPFLDLPSYIDAAARIGEVKSIDGAHWNLEIGCLTELMAEQDGPLLLFDNIIDHPRGFRVATNVLATARRFALALGLPTDVPKLDILKAWRNKTRDLKPYMPVEVPSGPIAENILEGERVDLAILLGCEPATWLAAPSAAKAGVSEYEYAGALRGAPLEVIRAPFTGLPVPASAEIVVEGEMPSPEEETHPEGPFGEWPGYYTHSGNECVVRVKRILHRNNPILLGNPPLLPITERYGIPLFAARIWDHLEQSGVSDVQGVWCHCHTLMVVVSLKQRHAGQAMHALTAIAGMQTGASMYRYYVAVDDDIDPVDLKQVIWAMCTRVDPAESVQVLKSWTSDLDPRLPPEKREKGDFTMSRMLIDACKPFHWRDRFALANKFSAEKREEIWEKWATKLQLK